MSLAFREHAKKAKLGNVDEERLEARDFVRFEKFEPSRTKQSFKDESDINNILARYQKSGMITHLAKHPGQYMDVSEVGDYREALAQVSRANEFFMGLPSKLRARFNNDPAEFLDKAGFLTPEELKEYGLQVLRGDEQIPAFLNPKADQNDPALENLEAKK